LTAEVKTLKGFGRDAQIRRRWLKMWEDLGERVLKLPEWMQNIVLEDINTAVRNRIATMEMIQGAKGRN
jgi:hypothetical protein